jgi:hypothetical protein
MIETDKYLVSVITTDATLISLMNITATDHRVYSWYPAFNPTFAETDCYIVYRKTMPGRSFNWSYPSQMPNINYHLRVMSIDQLVLGQVTERLIDLFDETYNVELDSYGVKKISITGNSDAPTEGDAGNPVYVKLVSFSFGTVVKRG